MDTYLVRQLTNHDAMEAQSVWASRFPDDSQPFMDWLFHKHFAPEHCVCVEMDGVIANMILGYPMGVRLRGTCLPAMMLYGVSTRVGYERRGLMHVSMQAMLAHCRETGFPAVFHTPVSMHTYASVGHLPCTRSLYHTTGDGGMPAPVWSFAPDIRQLTDCYRKSTAAYSGCVVRSRDEMATKMEDYLSDGAQYLTVYRGRELAGYALLTPDGEGSYTGEEALAIDGAAYRELGKLLPPHTELKLPPDAGLSGEIKPQGVMGAVDIPVLLSSIVHDSSLIIEVTDGFLPENSGVYDGMGRRTNRSPAFSLTAGELMQALCGYKALGDILPAELCYCIEPY